MDGWKEDVITMPGKGFADIVFLPGQGVGRPGPGPAAKLQNASLSSISHLVSILLNTECFIA